jgi:ubiquitin C-terminal hydrolase
MSKLLTHFPETIVTNTRLQLSQCFEYFATPEILDSVNQWFCPHCQEFVRVSKQMDTWKVPPVMVIHLKRLLMENEIPTKLNTVVEYPQVLEMSAFVVGPQRAGDLEYRLCRVSSHSGGLNGGHYIAHCLVEGKTNADWYCFNDSFVSEVTSGALPQEDAYLLFYELEEDYLAGVEKGSPIDDGALSALQSSA